MKGNVWWVECHHSVIELQINYLCAPGIYQEAVVGMPQCLVGVGGHGWGSPQPQQMGVATICHHMALYGIIWHHIAWYDSDV